MTTSTGSTASSGFSSSPTPDHERGSAITTIKLLSIALAAAATTVFAVKYYADGSLRNAKTDTNLSMDGAVVEDGMIEVVDSYSTSIDPLDIAYYKYDCTSCQHASALLDPNAPLAIIGGTMKGGTRALLTYLSQHPQVYTDQGNEVHLFDERHFEDLFPTVDQRDENFNESLPVDRCKVLQTYQDLYADKRRCQSKKHSDERIFFDKTPSYSEYSHYIPQRILCTFPATAKVIFVLRNPVDRTYSHYQHCNRKKKDVVGCKGLSFEESLAVDFKALELAGVLGSGGGERTFRRNELSPQEEYDAWVRYHNLHGKKKGNLMIAKSLYAIQLRHWLSIFRDHFGRDHYLNHLLILESEWMHANKQKAYNQSLDFVGLPRYILDDDADFHVGRYDPMKDESRMMLEVFYRSFNEELRDLLEPLGIEISWTR